MELDELAGLDRFAVSAKQVDLQAETPVFDDDLLQKAMQEEAEMCKSLEKQIAEAELQLREQRELDGLASDLLAQVRNDIETDRQDAIGRQAEVMRDMTELLKGMSMG